MYSNLNGAPDSVRLAGRKSFFLPRFAVFAQLPRGLFIQVYIRVSLFAEIAVLKFVIFSTTRRAEHSFYHTLLLLTFYIGFPGFLRVTLGDSEFVFGLGDFNPAVAELLYLTPVAYEDSKQFCSPYVEVGLKFPELLKDLLCLV